MGDIFLICWTILCVIVANRKIATEIYIRYLMPWEIFIKDVRKQNKKRRKGAK